MVNSSFCVSRLWGQLSFHGLESSTTLFILRGGVSEFITAVPHKSSLCLLSSSSEVFKVLTTISTVEAVSLGVSVVCAFPICAVGGRLLRWEMHLDRGLMACSLDNTSFLLNPRVD